MTKATAPYGSLPVGDVAAFEVPMPSATENVLVLSPRHSDAAVIAASTEVASLPAENLKNMQPCRVWRSQGTNESVTITTVQPVAADSLVLGAHNMSSDGVFRVRGAVLAANLTAAPDIDTGWKSAWPATGIPTDEDWPYWISLIRWTPPGAMQYWRLDIADTGNASGYFEIGRLMLGTAWQPGTNFDLSGSPLGFDPRDVQITTPYGRTFTDRRATSPARKFAIQISGANKRDVLSGIAEIQRLRGYWGDVACFLDPAETTDFHRLSMHGVFVGGNNPPVYPLAAEWDEDGNRFGASISLLELL